MLQQQNNCVILAKDSVILVETKKQNPFGKVQWFLETDFVRFLSYNIQTSFLRTILKALLYSCAENLPKKEKKMISGQSMSKYLLNYLVFNLKSKDIHE